MQRRDRRLWLAALGTVWVPVLITVSGITGFWPVFGVCAAAVLWTIWLFRAELGHITVGVPPDERFQRPFWLILPGISVVLFAAFPFVQLYREAKQPAPLTFEDVLQQYMHDRSVYVADLARTETVVHDKVFENVKFVGPAVIALVGHNDLYGVAMDANLDDQPLENLFLVVPVGTRSVGVIPFRDCIFKHCEFERVQFVGTQDEFNKWKASLVKSNEFATPPAVNRP